MQSRPSTDTSGRTGSRPGQRVAFFLPSLEAGGAERAATTIASELAKRGWGVDVVLARATGHFLKRLPPPTRVVDLKAKRATAATPMLARYLRRERPDVLVCSISNANVVGIAAASTMRVRPRTVAIEHTMLSEIARGTGKVRHRLVPPAARWAYPRADVVIAVSDGVADDIACSTRRPRHAITVIPNPVLTPELFVQAREPLHHPWFSPGEPPVILGVGSLSGPKDFASLIGAFARVREARRARLLVLGEGERRGQLESLVSRLGMDGDVLLPGFAPNPYPFMAGASLVALSSSCEGLPTVLIEALALGTPTVSTDCPSGPREILDGGRHGLLVAPRDLDALAAAMVRMLDDGSSPVSPRELARYSMAAVVDSYERVLVR